MAKSWEWYMFNLTQVLGTKKHAFQWRQQNTMTIAICQLVENKSGYLMQQAPGLSVCLYIYKRKCPSDICNKLYWVPFLHKKFCLMIRIHIRVNTATLDLINLHVAS